FAEVELPAVIVEQRVADEFYVLQLGEKIEERIAGRGNENFVAGIAEQAEDEGVGFAGAGGEEDGRGRNAGAAGGIVGGGGGAGGFECVRLGGILQCGGRSESCENFRRMREAAVGGIGGGEVEQRAGGGAMLREGFAEAIGGEVPVGAGGEHARLVFF